MRKVFDLILFIKINHQSCSMDVSAKAVSQTVSSQEQKKDLITA